MRNGQVDEWPFELDANAWNGSLAAVGGVSDSSREWAAGDHFASRHRATSAARPRADLADWMDDRVGWGLLLPDNPDLSRAERARADDAPESVQLLSQFRSPTGRPQVLRYSSGDSSNLYSYTPTGKRYPVPLTGDGPRGLGDGSLPWYVLIGGAPDQIPWDIQFALNAVCFTGRLDLDPAGLDNYINAALTSWVGSDVDSTSPLLWAVQHAKNDITWLMRQAVGERVLKGWQEDPQIGARASALRHQDATCDRLMHELAVRRPGVVVTTSHGMTGPLEDPPVMRATLGGLVDAQHQLLDPVRLLQNWSPNGVVWYAMACCSAGGSGRNQFSGLLDPDSDAGRVVEAVAGLGAVTSLFPRMLLGAASPARAFIGHVEPTFNWTLRRADSGLVTTQPLVNALYSEFFQKNPAPVGFALRDYFKGAVTLRSRWVSECGPVKQASEIPPVALLASLAGIDRQCTVILGDPAVAPAALPPP